MKLNGNHLLVASVYKLHKYQIFGLLKMHNISFAKFYNLHIFKHKIATLLIFLEFFHESTIWRIHFFTNAKYALIAIRPFKIEGT